MLLHGTPGASFVWSTTIRALGRGRLAVAPDLPGWGRSRTRTTTQDVALTRTGLRSWLSDVLSAQQLAQFDLVGLGDGALLALDILLQDTSRVRRLGLLNLPLKNVAKHRFRWPWQAGGWQGNKLGEWLVKESGLSADLRQHVGPMFGELFSGEGQTGRSPEFPAGEFLRVMDDYREVLSGFRGEALVAWGGKAKGYDPEEAARLCADRTPVVWSESGNFPMWEQPQQFDTEISEFLGQ